MIGGQENPPWIINKQEQFHPREPHHGVDGISAFVESGDNSSTGLTLHIVVQPLVSSHLVHVVLQRSVRGHGLSLIHISEPTRRTPISYAVFCLKKKKNRKDTAQIQTK